MAADVGRGFTKAAAGHCKAAKLTTRPPPLVIIALRHSWREEAITAFALRCVVVPLAKDVLALQVSDAAASSTWPPPRRKVSVEVLHRERFSLLLKLPVHSHVHRKHVMACLLSEASELAFFRGNHTQLALGSDAQKRTIKEHPGFLV